MGDRALPQHLTVTGALALTLCLVALLGAAGSEQAYALGENYKTGQVIVKLNPDPLIGATIDEIITDYESRVLDDTLGSKGVYLIALPRNSSETEIDFAKRLANDPENRVDYAEPNFVADTPENNTVGDGRHRAWGTSPTLEGKNRTPSDRYATRNLRLKCAAEISKGKGIKVAVLDTGAQLRHPALKANFEGVARYDFVGDDTNPSDREVGLNVDGDKRKDELVGHGTHVAGIVDRVAPAAKIMSLRVLNSEGYGDAYTIAEAISYAQRHEADVINLSLGTSRKSRLLREIIQDVIDGGVVVAAAAGNSNTSTPHYPAAGNFPVGGEGLLAVTSVNKDGEKSTFANYGLWVDVAAPGEDIRSAFPTSEYANWSGTSMATPFVSGQAALIRKVYGRNQLDPAAIEDKIRESARDILLKNEEYPGWTAGHADVCASLKE